MDYEFKEPGWRLIRWGIQLVKYDYEIVHISVIQNSNADVPIWIGSMGALEEQKEISNDKVRKQILYEFHNSHVVGHRGMNETFRTISSQYIWPKIRREVQD